MQYSTASQSHTRIQSITSLTKSQGGADGRDGAPWRDFTLHVNVRIAWCTMHGRSTHQCRNCVDVHGDCTTTDRSEDPRHMSHAREESSIAVGGAAA